MGVVDHADGCISKHSYRVLDPMDRISEVLFGLIMVLTITGSLSVATENHPDIRTMLIGAIGCNLAWEIIDAGMYLMAVLMSSGLITLRAVRHAPDVVAAQRLIADALPPLLASVLAPEQLELMRQKLCQLPAPPARLGMTKADGLGALAVFLLVFLSTFPVLIPFMLIGDVKFALRISHAIAIAMLFVCGYAFGRCAGLPAWPIGLLMVAIGGCLAGIAIALGG
jgi:VIT1/CCC1 family predicted Fe2+/Mn2+ transporter